MIPLFDCHCDTITRVYNEGGKLRKNCFHIDMERLKAFSPCSQVFAVCTELETDPVPSAYQVLNLLKSEINTNSDIVKLCLNLCDINNAVSSGRIAALISIEGAEQIRSLSDAFASGVRIIHITWNFDNEYCGAALGSGTGLTEKGRLFVHEAQNMGFALDMSHISEKGFWDVLDIIEKPVIAGHSNSKTVCPNPRNLSDEQFNALVKHGGGAGINLYPEFLGLRRDINAVIAHIEHFLSLGGEKSVFLGCDFDGIDITPEGLNNVTDIAKLYDALLKRNYSENLVKDIFWNNIHEIMGHML